MFEVQYLVATDKRGERKRKLLGMCDGQNAGGEREHSSVRLFPLCIHILGELALDHYPGFTTLVIREQ